MDKDDSQAGGFIGGTDSPGRRAQLIEHQIEHGQFIYSLPQEQRNDYQQIFQIRMLNARQEYVNVISRHQVIQKDKNGKAWMIMGVMDISPDQTPMERIKRTVINRKTGEILASAVVPADQQLTKREKEILLLIRQGFLSKEIAYKLNLSIYTVNNHRKNILAKLNVDNVIEALIGQKVSVFSIDYGNQSKLFVSGLVFLHCSSSS